MLPRIPRCLALLGLAATACFAADNSVLYWNQEAIDATRLSRNPPPMASLLFATYHVAIFDAVNGIARAHHGWLVEDRAPAGADMDAAAAGAARAVLLALWSQSVNPRTVQAAYDRALAAVPDGPGKTAGAAWGAQVAGRILAKRSASGFDQPVPGQYSSTEAGKWRETPSAFRPATLPYWGKVAPFVMTSPSQFRAPPPHAITSREYAEEMAYVAKVGPRDGADRTEYQTLCTPFWSDDLGTSTPPGHWNMVAQEVARRRRLSVPEAARLFALLNLAEADGAIQCWESKFYYNTWRPETALREQDPKTNQFMVNHPDFIPNLASPSFPAYPSGHSTFSAAGARSLALFIGTDDFSFDLTSDGLPGVVHHFDHFSDAQREAGMSRIWGGIHTMPDNLEAQKAGMKIADWVYAHALLPLNAP
ncbi:MAG TPA: vanadium-dependent haloperoxidase [Opitutaceae bacterium]|jgi:hypothetical protein|nr:vanadium-dependent haloperoxidase [Opitutaceae bacterium]